MTGGPRAWARTLRRGELILLTAFVLATVMLGFLARRSSPEQLSDRRRSTYLTGPDGAKGAADALAALGVTVERLRVPLFQTVADSAAAHRGEMIALVAPPVDPTIAEQRGLIDFVRRGGTLLLAETSVLRRFGFEARRVERGTRPDARTFADSARLRAPPGIGGLPPVHSTLVRARPDTLRGTDALPTLQPIGADTLLLTGDGRPVALLLWFGARARGSVLALADARLVTNAAFKNTDAGTLVLSWILARRPDRLIVDEYHQGVARRWAIVGVTWRWLVSAPGGWAILQLALTALAALTVASVRFGPAVPLLRRRRRSPLEHVEALGTGLERARGEETATRLIVQGLRRRLARSGQLGRPRGDVRPWVDSLALAIDRPEARHAVTRLSRLLRESRGDERVLGVAQTVEDVWEALRRNRPSTS